MQVPAIHATFYMAVREARGQTMPTAPSYELDNARDLLHSVGQVLVTLYKEERDADACSIGYPITLQSDSVDLLEINGDGEWDPTPTSHAYAGITRVDLSGPYELALTSISGFPPSVEGGKALQRAEQRLDPRTPSIFLSSS